MRKSEEEGLTEFWASSGATRVVLDPQGDLTELLDELRAGRQDVRDRLVTIGLEERRGHVVTLYFFAGMPFAEIADVLDVSHGTVKRDFRIARAWLRSQLGGVSE